MPSLTPATAATGTLAAATSDSRAGYSPYPSETLYPSDSLYPADSDQGFLPATAATGTLVAA